MYLIIKIPEIWSVLQFFRDGKKNVTIRAEQKSDFPVKEHVYKSLIPHLWL
jgi:hypothetical protein